jgi:ATP-dependent helicase/nuclease subunit A
MAIDASGAASVTLTKAQSAAAQGAALSPDPDRLADARAIAAFLASGQSFSRPSAGAKQAALVELLEFATPLKETAAKLIGLADFLGLRDDVIALGPLLQEFADAYLEAKLAAGKLSFQDVAELAVEILKTDPGLRTYYKERIRAIMIDEFQDDNELQKQLLYLIAERDDRLTPGIPDAIDLAPDKLFFVGDEKQSIYRFRGADVAVFRRLTAELSPAADQPALAVNYRSDPVLIRFFNAFFPGVFGVADRDYQAAFTAIQHPPAPAEAPEAPSTATAPTPVPPAIEFHLGLDLGVEVPLETAADVVLSAPAAEAFAAAARIARGVAAGDFRAGQVAILFRSTSHQHEYENALGLVGLPYVAADPRGVFMAAPINDLYAWLKLVVEPQDLPAFAAVLRSPLVGLGDDSATRLFLAGAIGFPENPADPSAFARPADAVRFESGRSLYMELRAMADRDSLADLFAHLWYAGGYRAALLRASPETDDRAAFALLEELARGADQRGLPLTAFLDEIAPLLGSPEKLGGGDPDAECDAVKLMTVHKSKGLEFPVVVVADCGNFGRIGGNAAPYFFDPAFGPVPNLKPEDGPKNARFANCFYDDLKEDEAERAAAELRRLFYVAATRAERRLWFFGRAKPAKEDCALLSALDAETAAAAFLRREAPLTGLPEKAASFIELAQLGLAADSGRAAELAIIPIEALSLRRRARLASGLRPAAAASSGAPGTTAEVRNADRAAWFALAPTAPPVPRRYRTTPSALEAVAAERRTSVPVAPIPVPAAPFDAILKRADCEAGFGTLCHAYLEKLIAGVPAAGLAARTPALAAAGLAPAQLTVLDEAARTLAEGFMASRLGAAVRTAARRSTEFPFLLPIAATGGAPWLVQGKIDVVCETADTCIIIDFKTDRTIDPTAHAVQLAAYRAAAAAFSDRPAESWLYYLRTGEAVAVDAAIDLGALCASATAERDYAGEIVSAV